MDCPHITVIIPSYDINKYNFLKKSIDSVLNQNYPLFDIIVITEGDKLTKYVKSDYNGARNVSIVQICNESGGVSVARNEGIEQAEGDVIAYIDSDAVAEDKWLHNIGKAYVDNENIFAVGGKSEANWLHTRPWYLPDEFLWLVGVTHKGHPPDGTIVRSTFGCNMSYKLDIFNKINNFNTNLGKNHGFNLQGEEPELGIRLHNEYNTGMYYEGDAIVSHAVEEHQTKFLWLCKRAYLQGITKYIIKNKHKSTQLNVENNYLKYLFINRIPYHLKSVLFKNKFKEPIGSIIGILLFTLLVGLGFVRGYLLR